MAVPDYFNKLTLYNLLSA